MTTAAPRLFKDDLDPATTECYLNSRLLAVDSETRGLRIPRDRLCVVQMCNEEGVVAMVQTINYAAPNLKRVLEAPHLLKLFHFARYDLATLRHWLGITVAPFYCTAIASRLARTYTDRHGLKDLAREFLGIELNKEQQSSDWAVEQLSPEQLTYAAGDVIHLAQIKNRLEAILEREGRAQLARQVMDCLPARVALDLAGWEDEDIFAHK